MKLKVHNLFLLFLIIGCFSCFPMTLYSEMKGSVSGIITDKDTGKPLEGVRVFLHIFSNGKPSDGNFSQTKTNEKGYFRMDDIREGQFFIGCEKPGYATICPDYLFYPTSPVPEVDAFDLKEGQVKYFKIQMERGGNLKVVVQRKEESGVLGIENFNFRAQIVNKTAKNDGYDMIDTDTPLTDAHGVSLLENFYPGEKLKLTFNLDGFPPVVKEVIIKKYETVVVTHIFDYTEKPGLAGKVYFKDKELISGYLNLVDSNFKEYGKFNIKWSPDFQFRNIEPGDYILYSFVGYEKEELKITQYQVRIEKGKTVRLDLNL